MIPLWEKLVPYALIPILLAGLYGYGHHKGVVDTTATWQARWTARDLAETQAKDAELARQKAAQDAAEARNAIVEAKLNDKTAETAAMQHDLDVARRLLVAARATRPSDPVPPAKGQPATPETSGAGEGEDLGSALAEALGECRRNADRLDALIDEITPQLVPH